MKNIKDLVKNGTFKLVTGINCSKLMNPRAVYAALLWSEDRSVPIIMDYKAQDMEWQTNHRVDALRFATENANTIGVPKQAILDACRVITLTRVALSPDALYRLLWTKDIDDKMFLDIDSAFCTALNDNTAALYATIEIDGPSYKNKVYTTIANRVYSEVAELNKYDPHAVMRRITDMVRDMEITAKVMVSGKMLSGRYTEHNGTMVSPRNAVLARLLTEFMTKEEAVKFINAIAKDEPFRDTLKLAII